MRLRLLAALALISTGCSMENRGFPYQNAKLPIETRVEDLLARMTPDERLSMVEGDGWMQTRGNKRLGIPPIHMADGPMGIRTWSGPGDRDTAATPKTVRATAFPA